MTTSGNVFEILFTEERISFTLLGIVMRHEKRNDTRTAELDNHDSKIYQESWYREYCVSYWRDLFSKLHNGNSEICSLGIAFRRIPWLDWLSLMESHLQDRSVCQYVVPSAHNVVDHWSGNNEIYRRSYDVAINWKTKWLPWFWDTWYEITSASKKSFRMPVSEIESVSKNDSRTPEKILK